MPVSSTLSKQNWTVLPPVFWKPMSVTLQMMTRYTRLRDQNHRHTGWRAGKSSLLMACAEGYAEKQLSSIS